MMDSISSWHNWLSLFIVVLLCRFFICVSGCLFYLCILGKLVVTELSNSIKMSSRHSSLVGVSYPIDVCLTCSSLHMDYYPRNYRVFLELKDWELPFLGCIKDDMLAVIFFCDRPHIRRGIKRTIGHEILFPPGKRLIYPSQILSIFLSNALDLLQSPFHLELIVSRFVRPGFLQGGRLVKACQKYDLWSGAALIGSLFHHHALLSNHGVYNVFESIKKALERQSFRPVKATLQ